MGAFPALPQRNYMYMYMYVHSNAIMYMYMNSVAVLVLHIMYMYKCMCTLLCMHTTCMFVLDNNTGGIGNGCYRHVSLSSHLWTSTTPSLG